MIRKEQIKMLHTVRTTFQINYPASEEIRNEISPSEQSLPTILGGTVGSPKVFEKTEAPPKKGRANMSDEQREDMTFPNMLIAQMLYSDLNSVTALVKLGGDMGFKRGMEKERRRKEDRRGED
ncbi:hypothetical protein PNOK_0757500 [Pyrrhoderma noxium]|uniref:Uncharacterized protein n=1 Tax=Pyrrhoderma noxium TaxID=2282107 RepID=A0A286UD46_9AGAM|nr:hypothetical protein PNOK_0757500 [Pyrrhoderma noxium]